MKFFACLLFVFGFCYIQADVAPDAMDKLKEHQKICTAEIGIDQELVEKARNGDFVEDQKLKDYLFCITKRAGFQNEEGKVQSDVLITKIGAAMGNPAKADELTKVCAKDGENGPDTALNLVKCYFDKTHISIV